MRFAIENYRSFKEFQEIDISSKFTFVTGQNNTGKSNVLRAIAIICSDWEDLNVKIERDRFGGDNGVNKPQFNLQMDAVDKLRFKEDDRYIIPKELVEKVANTWFSHGIHFEQGKARLILDRKNCFSKINPLINYKLAQDICRNFGLGFSSEIEQNLLNILSSLDFIPQIPTRQSVYIPSLRFMTKFEEASTQLNDFPINSEVITPDHMLQELRKLASPSDERYYAASDEAMKKIHSLISYSIEARTEDIKPAYDDSCVNVVINGERRALNQLGAGLEQLLFIAIGAAAFKESIILIEEPELHLHPRSIRRMLEFLNENFENKFVISTHSAAVLDTVPGTIHHVVNKGHESTITIVENNADKRNSVYDLGYRPSDLIQANFIIWVEGPSDRIYINHWISLQDDQLKEGYDYGFVFYGGSVLASHEFKGEEVKPDFLDAISLNPNVAVVMDRDTGSEDEVLVPRKTRVIDEVDKLGGFTWVTQGREIENYINEDTLAKAKKKYPSIHDAAGQFGDVLPKAYPSKKDFAKYVVANGLSNETLDLKKQIKTLIKHIKAASDTSLPRPSTSSG